MMDKWEELLEKLNALDDSLKYWSVDGIKIRYHLEMLYEEIKKELGVER